MPHVLIFASLISSVVFSYHVAADCLPVAQWKQIGPSRLTGDSSDLGVGSGFVRDIAIDPAGVSDQAIYIATNNGGIRKTTDGGATWPVAEYLKASRPVKARDFSWTDEIK